MEERVVVWTVFFEASLSSNDDRVVLKCDTSELRSICSKFVKAAVISLLKSVKLILFKGRYVKDDYYYRYYILICVNLYYILICVNVHYILMC